MTNIIPIFIELINSTLNLFIELYFFSIFWNIRSSKKITIPVLIFADLSFAAVLIFWKGSLLTYLPMFLITFCVTLLYEAKFLHRILFTLLLHGIMSATELITAIGITSLFSLGFNGAKTGFPYLAGILISKTIAFLVVLLTKMKKHHTVLQSLGKKYFGTLLFPLATLTVTLIQHYVFFTNPNQSSLLYGIAVAGYSFLALSDIIIFDFIDSIYQNAILSSRIESADKLVRYQEESYKTYLEHSNDLVKINHDHKNFCLGLISSLENGKTEEALSALQNHLDFCSKNIITPGNLFSIIIEEKRKFAEGKGILFDSDCFGLNDPHVPITDISVLLGNALDNAIHASEELIHKDSKEKPEIKLLIKKKDNTICIIIKNPVASDVNVSLLNGKTLPNKVYREHGIGIISMKQIAAKYNGEVSFLCENNLFTTMIFLNTSSVTT